ncbi:unnamed protein product [Blepharisma stoltei]|uniref:START domain-containing protein n=1 Tax=Blepharisma stoltei TaxID=1481888 RepID=A0AAU9IEL5_9CILI|nr:unnamed protein product [Blepharisma stoltei]
MEPNLEEICSTALERAQAELLDLINNPQRRWESYKEKLGLIRQRTVTDTGAFIVKSSGTINKSGQIVYDTMWDDTNKLQWNPRCKESKILHEFDSRIKIIYNSFKSPWPVTNRDFVFAAKSVSLGDDALIVLISITTALCPEKKGFVRGEMKSSGYLVHPVDENSCVLTSIISTDPKGSIPQSVVNKVQEEQTLAVHKIGEFVGGR